MSLLERLREHLAADPEVRLAALFGSQARGEERAGSDVDVAILLAEDSSAERREVEAALARALGREVDVIHLPDAPPLLRFEIARDGILLVERDLHSWVDFRTRAMIDWWDWAPTAKIITDAALSRLRGSAADGPS